MKNEYLEKFEKYLKLAGYSPLTISRYLKVLIDFLNIYPTPEKATTQNLIDFALTKPSNAYRKQAQGVFKHFFKTIVPKKEILTLLPSIKNQKKISQILITSEIKLILDKTKNLKHLAMLHLIYYSAIRSSEFINLKIENFHCDLMIEGEQEMTWGIGDHGFEMTLSTYVPDLIKKGVKSLIDNLLKTLELNTSQIQHFAIHPGGKKILEVIEEELNISKEDNKHAYQVMKNYGNMSSPTILFVLERIFLELEEKDKNSNILGLAFGPGLTLESMILKVS